MTAPLLALKQGYSALSVGMLLALFALTQVFLALPAGRYADRHGLKRPVGFAVLAASLGGLIAMCFPVYPVLCLTALLTGGASGVMQISLQRHVGRAVESTEQLKVAFSWIALGPAASNFVGPFCAGMLIDHAGPVPADLWGFRAAFLFMTLLPLTTWYWVRATTESVIEPVQTDVKLRAWDLLKVPMFRRLLIVNWLMSACWDVHTFVLPILGHERGLSASTIGTILGAFAIAAALIRLVLPLLASKLREFVVVTVAMVITASLFCIYPLVHAPWLMGLCSVLLGLVLGSVQPMIMSTLHQITPEARHGEAIALRLMAINASSVLMPMMFGAAGAVIGVSALFWLVGAAVATGSTQAWKLRIESPSP